MSTTTNDLILLINNISTQFNRYFSIFVFSFGVLGNILNFIVLSQPVLRINPCSFYFLTSSMASLISILSGLTTRMLAGYAVDLTNTIDSLCKLRIFVLLTSRTVALWLIAFASIDRWLLSSNNPLRRQRSSLKNAYKAAGIVLLFAILLYVEVIYCYQANLTQTPLKCYGKTTICRIASDFSYALISIVLPIVIMIIFGLLTILNVQRSRHRVFAITTAPTSMNSQQQGKRWKKTDYNLLIMLLAQTTLYCFFTLPQAIQKIYSTLTEQQIKSPLQNAIENLAFNILLLLTYFSSGMPFYVYTLCGGKIFRQTLVEVLTKPCKRRT